MSSSNQLSGNPNDEKEFDESDDRSLSDREIVLNDEEVWDDSLLIKMYENSQKQISDALMKTFNASARNDFRSNKSHHDDPKQFLPDQQKPKEEVNINHNSINKTNNNVSKRGKSKNSKSKKLAIESSPSSLKQTTETEYQTDKIDTWSVGDYCRAAYLEDNIEYEAKLLSLNDSNRTCLIQYMGYENEEWHDLKDLKPSAGKFARDMQINSAIQEGYEPSGKVQENNLNSNAPSFVPERQKPSTSSTFNLSTGGGVGSSETGSRMIPPPLPFINRKSENDSPYDEDDVLASMLMSWYMTGYHTGYYQAQQELKKKFFHTSRK